jgi:hypothetical protein
VRHNVRTLRPDYPPEQLWRMLCATLYEYQYLGAHLALTRVADARHVPLAEHVVRDDFVASGVLDGARFDALADAMSAICRAYSVDETRFSGAKLM